MPHSTAKTPPKRSRISRGVGLLRIHAMVALMVGSAMGVYESMSHRFDYLPALTLLSGYGLVSLLLWSQVGTGEEDQDQDASHQPAAHKIAKTETVSGQLRIAVPLRQRLTRQNQPGIATPTYLRARTRETQSLNRAKRGEA